VQNPWIEGLLRRRKSHDDFEILGVHGMPEYRSAKKMINIYLSREVSVVAIASSTSSRF
jgi:hypothetical protein